MKRPVFAILFLLACGSVTAGRLLQAPLLHVVKGATPVQQAVGGQPTPNEMSPGQGGQILQAVGGGGAQPVSSTVTLDARTMYANGGNFLQAYSAEWIDPHRDSIIMANNPGNSLEAWHYSKAGKPFLVDFRITPNGMLSRSVTVVSTGSDNSTTTWQIKGITHVTLAYFPSAAGNFVAKIRVTTGGVIVTGVTIMEAG